MNAKHSSCIQEIIEKSHTKSEKVLKMISNQWTQQGCIAVYLYQMADMTPYVRCCYITNDGTMPWNMICN